MLLLTTLVENGYVVRDSAGEYTLVRLPGERHAETHAHAIFLRVAEPFVRAAAESTGESAFVAIMTEEMKIRYVLKALPSNQEIRYDRNVSNDRIAHYSASGIAILSALPDEAIEGYLSKVLPPLEDNQSSHEERARVRANIAKARADGFATNLKGRIEGASGVAAPVFDRLGRPIGAINLAGPSVRFAKKVRQMGKAASETAKKIEAELTARFNITSKQEGPKK